LDFQIVAFMISTYFDKILQQHTESNILFDNHICFMGAGKRVLKKILKKRLLAQKFIFRYILMIEAGKKGNNG
jgi:hypothetical protein